MVHNRGCWGHAVCTSVSATCSLHLTVPHLVDACTVWLRKRVANVLSPGIWVASRWGYFPITWDTTLGASAAYLESNM